MTVNCSVADTTVQAERLSLPAVHSPHTEWSWQQQNPWRCCRSSTAARHVHQTRQGDHRLLNRYFILLNVFVFIGFCVYSYKNGIHRLMKKYHSSLWYPSEIGNYHPDPDRLIYSKHLTSPTTRQGLWALMEHYDWGCSLPAYWGTCRFIGTSRCGINPTQTVCNACSKLSIITIVSHRLRVELIPLGPVPISL